MRTLVAVLAMLALPASLCAQGSPPFPHERHAPLFTACAECHTGIKTGDADLAFPKVTVCAACHDGSVQPRVQWSPPARKGAGLLVFSHKEHAAKADDMPCESCHAVADPKDWMNVARAKPGVCAACHAQDANAHLTDGNDCKTCHRSLASAVALTDAQVAAFPKPPSHARADFVSAHHEAARASSANCATCHARESCQRCHVNGAREPLIRALGTDPRVARIVSGKSPVYPTPTDHRVGQFALVHGVAARADAARCAVCHARASCESCHTGEGARDVLRRIPDAREATAPGVRLRQATPVSQANVTAVANAIAPYGQSMQPPRGSDTTLHVVRVHPTGFGGAHGAAAASGSLQCASCHAQRYCSDCHAGERVTRRYHAANFVSTHAPQAYRRQTDCSSCHSTEAFCRDCHRQTGLAAKGNVRSTVFHNAQPLWLVQHGRAARQDLQSCTTCHQQTYCMQCHSDLGSRINPHGPGFNAARMSAKNPQLCLTCHFKNPLAG
jgi:hypothetical protein